MRSLQYLDLAKAASESTQGIVKHTRAFSFVPRSTWSELLLGIEHLSRAQPTSGLLSPP